MVTGVTGKAVGMLNSTSSNAIQIKEILFTIGPIFGPNVHLAVLTPFRPEKRDIAIGRAYESASAWTPTEMKAVNADVEPMLTSPSNIWTTVTRAKAQTGTPRRLSTLDHSGEPGIASSRAKAQVHREAATVMLIEQRTVMTSTRNMRPRPPPGDPITVWKMKGKACAPGALTMSVKGGTARMSVNDS